MTAWQGLLKKEFRLGRTWLITGLLLITAGIIGNYFLNGGFGYGTVGYGVFLTAMHFPYMGVYMFSSLNKESEKLHLWLHNPQSAWKLLLAKFLNGLFSMLISLMLVSFFTILVGKILAPNPPIAWSYIYEFVFFVLLNLVAVSLYIGVWVTLVWTVFRILKNIVGRWAWLVISVLITVSIPIIEDFTQTKLYYHLTNWGPIKLDSLQHLRQTLSEVPNLTVHSSDLNITLGFYVFHLVIILLVFLLSSWLLDNKVEV